MQECKQKTKTPEAGKPRRKHRKRNTGKSHGAETPKTKTKKKQPLGQKRKAKQNTQPPGRTKIPKTQKNLEVAMQDGVRIHELDCRQDTQGAIKTPGPPGTAGVSIAPAPEQKRRKKKKTNKQTHLLHSFLKAQVVASMPPTPPGRKEEKENQNRHQKRIRG